MNTMNPQDEMKQIIKNCIDNHDYATAYECLNIYRNSYISRELNILNETGPLISLICLQSEASSANTFLSAQNYKNIEVFYASSDQWECDIHAYLSSTDSKYVCFYEPFHKYDPNKLANMVFTADLQPDLNALICARNFIDEKGTVIANPDPIFQNTVNGKILYGQDLIEISIANNINLYGNLSTLLLSTQYVQQLHFTTLEIHPSIRTLAFFYKLILGARISFINTTLVSTILQPYQNSDTIKTEYKVFLQSLYHTGKLQQLEPEKQIYHNSPSEPIKREITFFYTDTGEYYNLKPLADEAEKRNYKINFTNNINQHAEIGVYCQHICHPENSKFSVILLHDLAQGHNRWPNIWELERWDKFDIGILPGKAWAERWSQCACQYYANPRRGAFNFGYPKNDLIHSDKLLKRAEELRITKRFKYDVSILYAPSWENDGKEDDFVKALESLPVNLLIKQASALNYPDIMENMEIMRKLHEGKYENVYYISPEESIQTALALCDLVVSDESSVMYEAVMFHKPSIAISDWLIPDTVPSRFASIPIDYVIKCQKSQLREYVSDFLQNPESFTNILKAGIDAFESPKNVCKNIIDAIGFYTAAEPDHADISLHDKKLTSKYNICSLWN